MPIFEVVQYLLEHKIDKKPCLENTDIKKALSIFSLMASKGIAWKPIWDQEPSTVDPDQGRVTFETELLSLCKESCSVEAVVSIFVSSALFSGDWDSLVDLSDYHEPVGTILAEERNSYKLGRILGFLEGMAALYNSGYEDMGHGADYNASGLWFIPTLLRNNPCTAPETAIQAIKSRISSAIARILEGPKSQCPDKHPAFFGQMVLKLPIVFGQDVTGAVIDEITAKHMLSLPVSTRLKMWQLFSSEPSPTGD